MDWVVVIPNWILYIFLSVFAAWGMAIVFLMWLFYRYLLELHDQIQHLPEQGPHEEHPHLVLVDTREET